MFKELDETQINELEAHLKDLKLTKYSMIANSDKPHGFWPLTDENVYLVEGFEVGFLIVNPQHKIVRCFSDDIKTRQKAIEMIRALHQAYIKGHANGRNSLKTQVMRSLNGYGIYN